MEKKEKTSPVPGTNMFDPTALLGASPFSPSLAAALPFAHLAHLPGAFSMLGHPAFPVSSLFGHLGDANPLGLPTSSLSSSLSPTSVASSSLSFDSLLSPILLSMGQGGPISDPFSLIAPPTSKGDNFKFGHYSSSAAASTTTTTSHSSSSSRMSMSPLGRSGSGRGGSGRGRRSGGRGRGRRGSKTASAIPLSLVQSTSILSPSMLEKFTKKHLESTSNGFSTETSPERKSMSSLFDINFDKDSHKNKPSSHSSSRRSTSPSRPSDRGHGNGETSTSAQEDVHIDSMKKKLLGDQIRHRMQSKAAPGPVDLFGSLAMGLGSRKRRGRPPKISQDECNLTPKELEEEARIQENIRQHLEMELKQKEMALKMIVNKDKEGNHSIRGKGKGRRSSKSPLKPPEGAAATNGKMSESDGHLDDSDAKDRSESEAESSKGKDGDLAGHYNFSMDMNDLGSGASCSEADNYTEDSDTGDDGTPGGKRKIEYNESGRPIKRRHVVLDDSKIRIPLEKGWKRQTNIHSYGRRGIVGEVWYFAPCGRKMKTIPDVMRYIERNNVTDLGRGHFSFNTKVNVGDFYEARANAGDNGFVKLSETEIQDRLSVTVSRRLKKIENQKKREKMKIQQAMARQMIESKMKQRMEQQEMARKVAEMQLQKKFQREQQRELMKRAKQMKIIEKKKQREMERQQREEQLRLKQELRAKQLLEKRQQKQAEAQKKRYVKALKRAEEQEMKRQQVALLKEQMRIRQEQERRRQHMILLKALEQRKKQEEREKQREEKIAERRLHRERKEEQRKMEFVLAQELKKPREDMELRDHRALPEYPRIKGNHLDGEAFADCLMSLEFLHNFAKPLGFDSESLPTLKSLQDAVSCKTEEDGEEYMSIVTHLMRYALDDPGVPNPKEAVTKLGQKITDLELTDAIISEVLRVFMVVRNGGETQLSEYLRNYPLEACSIKQRAAVIAFLCNELNCSKMITTEIEGHLETMGDIRRDKWVVEGKLRRLRSLRFKKFKTAPKPAGGEAESCDDSVMTSISKQSDDEDDKEDSGHEDENYNEGETEEDDPTSLEECEKAIDKLQKQHAQYRDKVFKESQYVRAIDLGQDRYKRNYWILPHAGGVFVEGLESGEIKDIVLPKARCERSDSKTVKVEVIDEKTEKKAVEFLEDIPEKKASDLMKKEKGGKEADSKDKLADLDKMFTDGKQVNGLIKSENESKEKREVKEVVKAEGENIKDENDVKVKSEGSENMSKGIEESVKVESLCNGDISDKTKDSRIINGDALSGNSEVKSPTKHVELKIPNIKSSAIEEIKSETDSNLYLHVPQSTKLTDFCSMSIDAAMKSEHNQSDHPTSISVSSSASSASATITSSLFFNTSFPDHVTKSSTNHQPPLPSPCPPLAHSKTPSCERKASFMSIDSILDKTSSHSSQPTNSLPVNPFVSQTSTRVSDSAGSDSIPWFTLLPRVPCDDMSLTRGQNASGMLMSPPFMSQLPFQPFSIQSPAFPSFQLGNLFSTSLTSTNNSSTSLSSLSSTVYTTSTTATATTDTPSFKKPEPVNASQHNTEDMLKSLQGEAKPIPEEYKLGWWKILEREKVHEIQRNLHPRGIRERSLHKTIQRFQEYTEASCTHGLDTVLCMESSSEEEVTDDEEDNDQAENDSAENSNKDNTEDVETKDNADNKDNTGDSVDKTNAETANENSNSASNDGNDMDASEDGTTDDDKPDDKPDNKPDDKQENSNNGCDNTDSESKDNTDPDSDGKESANKDTEENKKSDGIKAGKRGRVRKLSKVVKKKKMKKVKKPPPTIDCKARSDECDRLILEEVEVLEDKIATASLQIKGWKLAPKTFSEESEIRIISRGETKRDENDCYPLEAAKERLLQLELNIERRYLKPPLSKAHRISLNSMSNPQQQQQQQQQDVGDDNDSDVDFENLPIGLQLWRIGVATASSPAQLMLCVIQLNKSISWEKSIMKVLCQICRKDDNEAELLLCDGCDRGYHTYCFKPKIEEIPAGDWYCFECVAKASGETCCLVCGKRFGRMAECNQCNRFCHIDCLDPPLPRVPRKWHCASCDDNVKSGSAKKRVRKNSTASTQSTPSSTPVPDLTPSGRKRRSDFGVPRKRKASDGTSENETPQKKECDKGDKPEENEKTENVEDSDKFKQQEQSTDLKICRTMLTEMMKHEDGWPFLQPVNCKHFPSYRKYIKQPMDFGTMKIKLRDHVYQVRSEFTKDAITVFDNCQLFNEDDSEVGQCGHNMREFFTRRWKELIFEAMTEVDT